MANSKLNNQNVAYVRDQILTEQPAPASEVGIVGWMRRNLFSSVSNTILTLIAVYILYLVLPGLLNWSLFDAVWSGTDRNACTTTQQGGLLPADWSAACWPYVGSYLKLFIYGRYPDEELWRVNLVLFLFFVGLVPLLMPEAPFKRENIVFMLLIFPVITLVLMSGGNLILNGFILPDSLVAPSTAKFWLDYIVLTLIVMGLIWGYMRATESNPVGAIKLAAIFMAALALVLLVISVDFGLTPIETPLWGGFVMTLVIAVTGIVVSLPLGIVLALGRRSEMPATRLLSVIFIEFWRGVPLITVLFMSSVLLPLFLPDGVTFDKLLRALIGVALFSTAYMA